MFAKVRISLQARAVRLHPRHADDPVSAHDDPVVPDSLQFNLTNNLLGLVALSWFNAFGIFLMRQFMQSIPDELLDAARVDGASEWTIYARIVIPQVLPALATFGILVFISNWNAYLWPLIVLQDVDVRTLPIILTWYNDRHTSDLGLQMAASIPDRHADSRRLPVPAALGRPRLHPQRI
ncbi:MAG: carbohydrate ABC transporter permease [Chloroflexi bacterium]|uniref:carbohydrate ABC transporter permease n=1 Tax=Candidatus Flexifilum breve TaxID=3140694 RepID=UPI0031359867|nr:carbohydrate ABC transporter permease [Chloroflexota bacterium]